ncbi:MAG: hypothetical protein KAR20_06345, partial [Candidatus Heimdallarchaeota archaeon]|nr:hypothetical protein [Candidatus Heimdallarchaeota archaeon]
MNNKKTLLWVGIGIFSCIVVCLIVIGSIWAFGYYIYPNAFNFENWTFNLDEIISTEIPVIPTEIPLGTQADLEELFAPMWETIEKLHEHSVYQPIDDKALADGALEGLNLYFEEIGIDPDE